MKGTIFQLKENAEKTYGVVQALPREHLRLSSNSDPRIAEDFAKDYYTMTYFKSLGLSFSYFVVSNTYDFLPPVLTLKRIFRST